MRPDGVPRLQHDRGFALLAVLWTLAALALLFGQMISAGRSETGIAANLRAGMDAEAAADGAVHLAAYRVLDRSDQHWDSDGAWREARISGAAVRVRVTNEADRVNLNTASPELLRALLIASSSDVLSATRLTAAILAWRGDGPDQPWSEVMQAYREAGLAYLPPRRPFRSTGELAWVAGMPPALAQHLLPLLTIDSTYGPGRSSPDPVIRQALDSVRASAGALPAELDAHGVQTVRVVAEATSSDGGGFIREAVLRLNPSSPDLPMQVLSWQPLAMP